MIYVVSFIPDDNVKLKVIDIDLKAFKLMNLEKNTGDSGMRQTTMGSVEKAVSWFFQYTFTASHAQRCAENVGHKRENSNTHTVSIVDYCGIGQSINFQTFGYY